ncbi:MAG: hypothetical protein ACRDT6_05265 [Micromonosporaceae bacterium]
MARARAADKDSDTTAASAVYNLAALIASDCGLPDLARQWCHEHAAAYLRAPAMGAQEARHALEPLVNLARLHIRDGNGDAAFHLLDNLYEAVDTRTDTVIDGIPIPAATITTTDTDHRELRRWLWSVHLADGTRALTSAGRWQDAHQHLQARKGIGRRMLDGRQVAVIAHATADDHDGALELLDTTAPGEPWQDAVTACLTALCAEPNNSAIHRTDALKRYRRLVPKPPLAVFQTRLGLSVLDAIGGAEHPAARDLAAHLVTQVIATRDGYIARDLLAHDGCVALINDDQARDIAAALDTSGLGRQAIPSQLRANLSAALATSAAVLARELL